MSAGPAFKKFMLLERAKLDLLRSRQISPAEIDRLLSRYLRIILNFTNTSAGSILLREGEDLVFRACIGSGARRLMGQRMSLREGIAGQVARTGRPRVSPEVSRDPSWSGRISGELRVPTRNLLAVPLRSADRVIGVIEVINRSGGSKFSKQDRDMLSALAGQLSLDLEYLALLAESRREAHHRSMQMQLASVLNSTLDQREVRRRAMEAATELMDAEVGSLLMVDARSGDLFFEVALGEKGERLKEVRLKMGEGIAGWVALQDKPALVNDVANDPRHFRKAGVITKFVTRNMLCVPVRSRGKVIGVLQAINKKDKGLFTEEDLGQFMTLSNQVAVALENASLYEELKETFVNTAAALAMAVEKKDPYTGGHIKRVVEYSLAIAQHLDGQQGGQERLRLAAVLHDIGKIGIRDNVLLKQDGFTPEELSIMRTHPLIGAEILAHIEQMNDVRAIMRAHHEKWDGSGYPEGLRGEAIPLEARVISVADALDAITTDRPYRKAAGLPAAQEEISRNAGKEFDPAVVAAFMRACDKGDIIIGT